MSHTLSTPSGAPPHGGRRHERRWLALVLLCVAQFMLILDLTVVNVALPSIGADLGAGREALTWVVTGYVLAFGGLMLLGGRLADTVGRRRTLIAGLAVFTLASLVAGLSGDVTVLIAARAAQGVGAALLSPAALSVITTTFQGTERNRALGVWAALGGSGAAVGVLLGGVLASGPGWEWIFYVNVPVGAAILIALPAVVPPHRARPGGGRPDVAGALLVTSGLASLVYGLVQAGDAGWVAPGTVVPVVAAAVLLGAFAVVERKVRNPLVRLPLLRHRPVVSGTFVMLTASGFMLGFFFLASLYMQEVLGFSALRTGVAFLPVAVAITAGAHLSSRLVGSIGGRPVAAAAFLMTAAAALMLTRLNAGSDAYTGLLPWFALAAFGIGAAFVVATTTTLANVPHHEAGLASGVVTTFHEVGGAVGVAVFSAVAATSIGAGVATTGGFTDAFLVSAVAAAAAAVAVLWLVPAGRVAGAAAGHGH